MPTQNFDVDGKRILITGASSNGMGAHLARTFASKGARVIVAARRRDLLDDLVTELGAPARAVTLDVADGASIRAAVTEAGPIDVLVNNAGVTRHMPTLKATAENFDYTIGINLRGPYLLSIAIAAGMVERGNGGSIINVASIVGMRECANMAAYAISKAGLIAMTKQFALDLGRHQIRVNAIAPGFFLTDLNRSRLENEEGKAKMALAPLGRGGRLSELEGVALLLASDASTFINGSVITVDGGMLRTTLS